MGLNLGNTNIGEIYLGNTKIAEAYLGSSKIYGYATPVPSNTVRVRTSDGNAPVKGSTTSYETATLVTGTSDVYDVYKSGTSFERLLYQSTNVIEVIAANTANITSMRAMFGSCTALTILPLFDTSSVTDMSYILYKCSSLTTVPLFDTSSVTDMSYMLFNCSLITTVPLFDTSSVTNMSNAFNGCTRVQSGALALYQQASTQTTPPSQYLATFRNCGSNTSNGRLELAQIPSNWK